MIITNPHINFLSSKIAFWCLFHHHHDDSTKYLHSKGNALSVIIYALFASGRNYISSCQIVNLYEHVEI